MNKAIVDLQFYNIKSDEAISLYAIGKSYGAEPGLNYLGFIKTDNAGVQEFIYAEELGGLISIPYNSAEHTGIKRYTLRRGLRTTVASTQVDINIIGHIILNWDEIPSGSRVFEGNVEAITNNSRMVVKSIPHMV